MLLAHDRGRWGDLKNISLLDAGLFRAALATNRQRKVFKPRSVPLGSSRPDSKYLCSVRDVRRR